jgi:hypothetical protein
MRQSSRVLLFVGSFLFTLLVSFPAQSQVIHLDTTSYWKKSFMVGLNLNQASFSDNWKAGGVNSIGFNTRLGYKANFKKDLNSWDNEMDFQYGMVNSEGQGYRKTLDRFYIDTKYGYALSKKWDVFVALNFLSQFAKGYKYEKDAAGVEQSFLISDMLAPAFVTSSWGLEYHPVDYFKVRFAPFAPRLTVVRNNDGRYAEVDSIKPYGVEVGKDTRFEWLAFQMLAELNKDIAKNVNLKMRYVLFANYETLALKTIDHRVDLNLTAKVNQFINVSIGGILLYDFDQDSGAQISQAFSLGVLYAVQNYKEK